MNKGHCWGSLFWQFNDCWPGPSWSAIDVFGRKKAFYDELKTLFAPVAIIPFWKEGKVSLTIVNDTLDDFEGELRLEFESTDGVKWEEKHPISCSKNDIRLIYKKEIPDLMSVDMQLLVEAVEVFSRKHSFQ